MKKKIFAILLVVSMIAGMLPSMVYAAPAGPARFLFTDSTAQQTPTLEVIINEGDSPVYLKTAGKVATATGASASEYNIKITYETGKNPTVYLNGADLSAYGNGSGYPAITIGSDTNNSYNNVSVDVIAENGTSWLYSTHSYAPALIKSYVDGTLTLSSENNGLFDLNSDYGIRGGNDGFIQAKGDLVLKNAKFSSSSKFHTRPFLNSTSGNITIDGGTVSLTKKNDPVSAGGTMIRVADGKKITIENGASVSINDQIGSTTIFSGATEIKDSSVGVTFAATGVIFSAIPTLAYTDGYTVTADGNSYDNTNFGAVLATGYNTIQNLSIMPKELPQAKFTFMDACDKNTNTFSANLAVTIKEGNEPVYLKTVGNVATAEGASATDYNIKIAFPTGGKPTLYLKGANIDSWGDGKGLNAIMIGSASAADACNNTDVNIVIEEGDTNLSYGSGGGWGSPNIKSYINGTLTISSVNGGVLKMMCRFGASNWGAIDAQGDIVLKDLNLEMYGYGADEIKGYYIHSIGGNITIDGGEVSLTTTAVESNRAMVVTSAAGKNITIQNGAKVAVDLKKTNTIAFSTQGDLIIADSDVAVVVTGAGSTIAAKAPVIQGYAAGYTAKGNNAEYKAADWATYTSFSIVGTIVRSAKFAFIDNLDSAAPSSNMVVNIAEGGAPVYLKVAAGVATATGASETDYNIKITFENGKNPTLYLKNANLKSYGDARGTNAIVIGSAIATDICNTVSVDIVVEANSNLTYKNSWGDPNIKSYITGALTISSANDAVLTMEARFGASNHGAIDAIGDINLKNAKVVMNGNVEDRGYYIHSTTGNITVDGGTLDITTASANSNRGIFWTEAADKNITIDNAAVNIAVRNVNCTAFKTAGNLIVKDASLAVVISGADSKIADKAPVIQGYAGGYIAKKDGTEYVPATDAAAFNTYKSFSLAPFVPTQTTFTFMDACDKNTSTFSANLAVTIKEGDEPVYLKTVGNVATAEGASATDYNIKIAFPTGGKPTLYLKGANIDSWGDGRGLNAIMIGSTSAADACNNADVNIVIEEGETTLKYGSGGGWGSPNIKSYINGTLTISSVNGGVLNMMCRFGASNWGAIDAQGDIVLKDLNLEMYGYSADQIKGYYIHSIGGNITIDGGELNLTTTAVESNRAIIRTSAAGKNITIQGGAKVDIDLKKTNTVAFDTQGDVFIKDSIVAVRVSGEGSTIAAKAPVIQGYTEGFVAKKDGTEYVPATDAAAFNTYKTFSIEPYVAPQLKFTFADDARTANLVKIIKVGDAPIYLTTKAVTVGSYTAQVVTEEGANASNYSIMITFPEGGKPTLTLKGATIANGDVNGYNIIIGDSVAEAVMNDLAVDIVVAENSQLNHVFNWAVPNLLSYVKGDLTFKGDGKLTVTTYAHGSSFDSAIYATGNVKFDDIDVDIKWHGGNTGYQRTNYITSANGNITVNGGKMTIVTHSLEAAAVSGKVAMNTPNGKVVIENGAEVGITVNANVAAFATKDGVVINNSSVIVAGTTGIAFSGTVAPTFEGYGAEGYIAEGDGAEYKAADFATYKTFSIRPYQVPTTRFTFVDSLETGAPTANVVVNIKEGDAPIYLKTVNKVVTADGASADDYNIKITFETGKNPTLYLKGASITSYGDAKGNNAILIGSASATEACNAVSVDIVVETNSILEYKNGWGDSNIKSYITGTLTISSVNNAVLDLMGRMAYGNQGVIDAQGDILLKNANLNMYGYSGDDVKGYYIHSANGNITFDGGKLTAITRALTNNCRGSILCTSAAGKNITVQNGAVLDFTINKIDTIAFKTQGDVIIKDASVAVTINAEGSKIAEKAPVIEGYANGYVAKANNAVYKPEEDAAKFAEFITFSIRPYEAPKARFVFQNFNSDPFAIEVIIEQGGAPVFLKTVGGIVTAEGASADDYQIKITFEKGKSPNLYLKGAEIKTYGDAKGDHAILIGSETATDVCNDNNVNIVIQRNSTISNTKTYGSPLIKSYITGTLTITKEKGSLTISHMVSPVGNTAAVETVGDLVLKNVNMKVESHHSGADRYNYFRSSNGNIIVNAGKLTITTNSDGSLDEKPTHKRIFKTEADGKNIVFENGASVTITVRNSAKIFGTKGEVIFDNATVKINITGGGSIFDQTAPVIKNYAEGTVALGDNATYDATKFAEYKTFTIEGGEPVFDEDYNDDIVDGTGTGSGDSDDDNGSGSGSGSTNPSTGDNTNLALLSTLVVISALGMVALVVIGKKRFTV